MSKVFIEEDSLTAIGNAIRSKTGDTAPLSVPTGMVEAIAGITGGGGGGVNVNGELKTVTAKTAVSKGDMVQYSENTIKAAAPLDSYTLGQYFDPTNYPWGISWVSDEVGILWSTPSSSSNYNIYVYALKFEGDGLITTTLIATYEVGSKNESFLE